MNELSWHRPNDFKETWANFVLESWSQTIIIGKMGGWIDEWMNGLTDGWMSGWTDRIKGDKKCNEIFVLDKPRPMDNGQIRLFKKSFGVCMGEREELSVE